MDPFWTLCLQHFEDSLPPQQFRTWIQPLKAARQGSSLVLEAPNRFVLQWVKDRFLPVIEQLARERHQATAVVLELAQPLAGPASSPPAVPAALAAAQLDGKPRIREGSRLNPAF